MSSLLESIFGTLGNLFGNFLPSWGSDSLSDNITPSPYDNMPDNDYQGSEGSETSSEYDTADKGEDETNQEDSTMQFRLIEDPASKRLIEEVEQGIMDNEEAISKIYKAKLHRLDGIKTKIMHIAHMINNPDEDGEKEEDIAFPSDIIEITRQDHIDVFISHAYQPLRGSSHFDLPNPWNKPQLGINAPASLRDIDRFEENNLLFAVNVFKPVLSENGEELKTHKLNPLRISEYNYQRKYLIDLILFTQGEEGLTDRRNHWSKSKKSDI
ncbi:unnamed protein product [Rhizophagus irregularis]|nr:unnamed protein product [Rhizophagus irregularis]